MGETKDLEVNEKKELVPEEENVVLEIAMNREKWDRKSRDRERERELGEKNLSKKSKVVGKKLQGNWNEVYAEKMPLSISEEKEWDREIKKKKKKAKESEEGEKMEGRRERTFQVFII